MRARIFPAFFLMAFVFMVPTRVSADTTTDPLNALLDAWHNAAATADGDAYFGAMTENAVFIGTDASERWLRDELREWGKDYFARDSAWVFKATSRNVSLSPSGDVAWFDEQLDSPHMGETRGSGVLVKQPGGDWKIAHYTLSFAVPNSIADDVIKQIAEATPEKPEPIKPAEPATVQDVRIGTWLASIELTIGPAPFGLEIEDEDGEIVAYYTNADETIRVPTTTWEEGLLVFNVDYHDSQLTAVLTHNGTQMHGQYIKRKGGFMWDRLAFSATFGDLPRFESLPPDQPSMEPAFTPIDGKWEVVFADNPSEHAIGVFESVGGNRVFGTFLTTVGDYRFLEGVYENNRLRLSVFDGAHCFLFDAKIDETGALKGDFYSGAEYHTEFTATRNEDISLGDPFALSKWKGKPLGDFSFPDPDGVE